MLQIVLIFYLCFSFNAVDLVQKDILIGQKMNISTAHHRVLRSVGCPIHVVLMQQIFRYALLFIVHIRALELTILKSVFFSIMV